MRVKDLELCTLFAFTFVELLIFSHNFTSSIICLSKDERLYSLPTRPFYIFLPSSSLFSSRLPLAASPRMTLSAALGPRLLRAAVDHWRDPWCLMTSPTPLPTPSHTPTSTPYPLPLPQPPPSPPTPPYSPTHPPPSWGKRRHMKGKVEEGKGKRRGSKCCALLSKESEWWSRGKF